MEEISPLKEKLKEHFPWNQARIDFLARFLIALISKETVNLVKIAKAFSAKAKPDSSYKRIKRFLRHFEFDLAIIAKFVVLLFPLEEKWLLCLDRTNWKFGKTNINILMLAVAYKGIAIPLFWVLLDKRGNSNTRERAELLKRFFDVFGKEKIRRLTADREFIGSEWIAFLKKEEIPFCLRVKKTLWRLPPEALKRKSACFSGAWAFKKA